MTTEEDCCVLRIQDGETYPAAWYVEGKCRERTTEYRKTLVQRGPYSGPTPLDDTLPSENICATEAMGPMQK